MSQRWMNWYRTLGVAVGILLMFLAGSRWSPAEVFPWPDDLRVPITLWIIVGACRWYHLPWIMQFRRSAPALLVPGFGMYVVGMAVLDAMVAGLVALLVAQQPAWLVAGQGMRLVALGLPACTALPALLLVLFVPPAGPRRDLAYCPSCGYCLTGNLSGVCPECGQPVPQELAPAGGQSARTATPSGTTAPAGATAPSGTPRVFQPWFQWFAVVLLALLSAGYLAEGLTGARLRPPVHLLILVGALLWRLKDTVGRADVVPSSGLGRRLRRYAGVVIPVDVLLLGLGAAAWEWWFERSSANPFDYGTRAMSWAVTLWVIWMLWFVITAGAFTRWCGMVDDEGQLKRRRAAEC